MNGDELKATLLPAVQDGNAARAWQIIADYKANGGEQRTAFKVLSELSDADETYYDFCLVLMDCVCGWGNRAQWIWDKRLLE